MAILTSIPLLRAPGPIAFSASGDIYLVESCDPSCEQIGRHEQSGGETRFGDAFYDSIRAMQFIASGELIVELNAAFGRLDANGRCHGAISFGFDVDRDQCTVIFSSLQTLTTMNICSGDPEAHRASQRGRRRAFEAIRGEWRAAMHPASSPVSWPLIFFCARASASRS